MFYYIKHVCVDFESRRPGLTACYPVKVYLWFVTQSLDKDYGERGKVQL